MSEEHRRLDDREFERQVLKELESFRSQQEFFRLQQARFIAHMESEQRQRATINDFMRKLDRVIFGTDEKNVGFVVRLDRIEQSAADRHKHYWVIYPAITVAIIKAFWDWVTQK